MRISIVIPAYNEEASITLVVREVRRTFEQTPHPFEVIVVDDASTDATRERVKDAEVNLISHLCNKGYGRSIKDGIREALYEYILIMDSDGQHNPQNILKLLQYAEEYDMVVGARAKNGSDLWRLPGKWFLSKLCNYLSRTNIPDVNSGLRIFKKDVISQYLHLCSDGFSFTTSSTLAFLADDRDIKYVDIEVTKRKQGKSHVTVKTGLRTILLVLQIIMVFHPLRFFLPINGIIGVIAGISLINDIIRYNNITDITVLLVVTTIGVFFFSLIADQISKLRREIQAK